LIFVDLFFVDLFFVDLFAALFHLNQSTAQQINKISFTYNRNKTILLSMVELNADIQ